MCLRRLYAIINLKVGDDMEKRHMNVIAIIIIIIILSTIVFLWKVFLIWLGSESGNRDIQVTNYNIGTINSIMSESCDFYEEIPDISNATRIEYNMLMHKDRVTIYYEDETEYVFIIRNGYENEFTQYMRENGSILYFKSSEFVFDLVEIFVSFSAIIVCLIILIRNKHRIM